MSRRRRPSRVRSAPRGLPAGGPAVARPPVALRLALLVLLVLFATACASVRRAPDREDEGRGGRGRGGVETGLASFYADALEGRRTASGERYRARAATCAHRSHPFGTRLEVQVIDTGERAICRVNDRGPFVRGRVVDLSKRVARQLDLVGQGVARVRVRPVGPPGG